MNELEGEDSPVAREGSEEAVPDALLLEHPVHGLRGDSAAKMPTRRKKRAKVNKKHKKKNLTPKAVSPNKRRHGSPATSTTTTTDKDTTRGKRRSARTPTRRHARSKRTPRKQGRKGRLARSPLRSPSKGLQQQQQQQQQHRAAIAVQRAWRSVHRHGARPEATLLLSRFEASLRQTRAARAQINAILEEDSSSSFRIQNAPVPPPPSGVPSPPRRPQPTSMPERATTAKRQRPASASPAAAKQHQQQRTQLQRPLSASRASRRPPASIHTASPSTNRKGQQQQQRRKQQRQRPVSAPRASKRPPASTQTASPSTNRKGQQQQQQQRPASATRRRPTALDHVPRRVYRRPTAAAASGTTSARNQHNARPASAMVRARTSSAAAAGVDSNNNNNSSRQRPNSAGPAGRAYDAAVQAQLALSRVTTHAPGGVRRRVVAPRPQSAVQPRRVSALPSDLQHLYSAATARPRSARRQRPASARRARHEEDSSRLHTHTHADVSADVALRDDPSIRELIRKVINSNNSTTAGCPDLML